MTIWTTFFCGGVSSAGWTAVAGTERLFEPGARFPGTDELETFRTMVTELGASAVKDSVLLFGLSVVSVEGCSGECEMAGWLARRAAMVLLLRRDFLAGSMRTAFSIHIS